MYSVPDRSKRITLNQLTMTFVPFAFALIWAFMFALGEPAITYARAQHLIWISLIFSAAAFVIYALSAGRRPLGGYWRLLWSFGLLAYLMHFYYGYWIMYQGQLDAVFSSQGSFVAGSNFLLTALWIVDVMLAWSRLGEEGPLRIYRLAVNVLVLASFFTASVLYREGTVRLLGIAMTVIVLIALALRMAGRSNPATRSTTAL